MIRLGWFYYQPVFLFGAETEARDTTRLATTQLGTSNTFLGIHHPLCQYLFITACMDIVTITFFFLKHTVHGGWGASGIGAVNTLRCHQWQWVETPSSHFPSIPLGLTARLANDFHQELTKAFDPTFPCLALKLALFFVFNLCIIVSHASIILGVAVVMIGYYNQRICLGIFKL